MGYPANERLALNHDRLWRRYWKYRDRGLYEFFPAYQKLCLDGKYNEAFDLMGDKISRQGKDIYVNPFVPVGDLGIHLSIPIQEHINYKRLLDMENALVEVSFAARGVEYTREYFASFPAGVLAVNIDSSQTGLIDGDVFLYRIPDEECLVSGYANDSEIVMVGEFDEGVKFAVISRIISKGGAVATGLNTYLPPEGVPAGKLQGFVFGFRELQHPNDPCGVSVRVCSADEITILTSVVTDREIDGDIIDYCKRNLDLAGNDYQRLKDKHVNDYRRLYDRVTLNLGGYGNEITTPEAVNRVHRGKRIPPEICERMFKLARYIGISAGRELSSIVASKAPINLQGIWNEDPRPPWDSDGCVYRLLEKGREEAYS